MFQFIRLGVGRADVGKKAKTNATHRYTTAMPSIQIPTLPSENREGRRRSPRQRLTNIHDVLTIYEDIRAHVPNDVMELKATVLPMLTRDKPMAIQSDTMTLLTGISQPGRTYDKNGPKGTP